MANTRHNDEGKEMKTIQELASAITERNDRAFSRLEQKWGIAGLEVIAKLAAESGVIRMDDFYDAKSTLQW
jgi:hypothetical protein